MAAPAPSPATGKKRFAGSWLRPQTWSCVSWCRKRFGLPCACQSYFRLLRDPETYIIDAKRANVRSDIAIRPGTADQTVFNEVFVHREYDVEGSSPKTIIDAGAHIGLTSVMFANRFPGATIIAIEPEPDNYRLLARNARSYPNIKPVHAGLWSRATTLRIENPDAATWGFRVIEDADASEGIRAVSVPQLMEDLRLPYVDLLKLDIEGAEVEVLRASGSWIGRVGMIMIEVHDRFRPGCTQALEEALAGYTFERSVRGTGNTFLIRNLQARETPQRAPGAGVA